MPRKPGFPEPLFEDISELETLAEKAGSDPLVYLIFGDYKLGALRAADPILGDLTVMAQEAVSGVAQRMAELEDESEPTPTRVVGAVPEEQA